MTWWKRMENVREMYSANEINVYADFRFKYVYVEHKNQLLFLKKDWTITIKLAHTYEYQVCRLYPSGMLYRPDYLESDIYKSWQTMFGHPSSMFVHALQLNKISAHLKHLNVSGGRI